MVDTRVVYLEPGQIKLETITLPQLKSNQVLVKTHQASVCGSEAEKTNFALVLA